MTTELLVSILTSHTFWFTVVTLSQLILEYWLGKTDKTKSGSILELALNFVTGIKNNFFKGEK